MLNKYSKQYDLMRSATAINEYGEQAKDDYQKVTTLTVSVMQTGMSEISDNPKYWKTDYVGIYRGSFSDFRERDRLGDNYEIAKIVSGGRKTYLFLKEV